MTLAAVTSGPVLGLDVGGSAVKAGLVSTDGRLLSKHKSSARSAHSFEELVDAVLQLALELPGFTAVGVGVPGLLDYERGVVERSPNLPWIDGRPLRSEIARRLGLDERRVLVENDANAAALGESWLGAGRARDDIFMVTLGTGIGGGVVLGNRLWRGRGMAGEIGHVKIHDTGPMCGCGRIGCLETFASATAARRRALELGLPRSRPGDLEELTRCAAAGPGPERELLEAIGEDLGRGVGCALNLFDLRTYVFGGGFAAAYPLMAPGVLRGIDRSSYGQRTGEIELLSAELGPSAGWIGAARAVMLDHP